MTLASKRVGIKWGGSMDGRHNPNFKGGRYVDDKGYVRVLRPDHPYANAGYVYEHRLVAEEYLGRYLRTWETVHHINEIKTDNRWENFYLTTGPEHSSIHREGKKKSPAVKEKMRKVAKERMKNTKRGNSGKFEAEAPAEDSDALVYRDEMDGDI